ncbi:radical SAM protein [Candidatus Micrarchaeota archaeon]|nr:MAG: radical SAM protein [Candidatus Micrarchaeota archaeon]
MVAKKIKETESICPVCFKVLKADIIEEDGKIYLEKTCPEHGHFKETYWSDAKLYHEAAKYLRDGPGIENPAITKENPVCPHDCGLCKLHLSTTGLANIFVTNRCNLRCWYCFANVGRVGKVFDPPLEVIEKMLDALRAERPVPAKALQITGGEPTVRDDLIDIIKMAKEKGFTHIQLNTNGIKTAEDPELCVKVRKAGVNVLYMSFDGVTMKSNPWLEENKKTIENCRKVGLGVVLVPTLIRGVNDQEVGDIIRFAAENSDIVRGVNFQPVSFVGSMPAEQRNRERVTIPDLYKWIEEQTDGQITGEDFYPIPSVVPVSKFSEAWTGELDLEFTAHPHCGGATYVYIDKENNKLVPITKFVDVKRFFNFLEEWSEKIKKGGKITKAKFLANALIELNKIIDSKKAPKEFDLKKIILEVLAKRDYHSLGEFHYKMMFIGNMHFMDPYNYDIERVKRCVIHYAMPDGRIVPFCAFWGLQQEYAIKMQLDYGESPKEWEARTGKKLKDDLYYRWKETAVPPSI